MSDRAHMRRKIFVSLLLVMSLLSGCGSWRSDYNRRADDAISQAIYEELGNSLFYDRKESSSDNVVYYDYHIKEESSNLLYKMIEAVNQAIVQEEIQEKIFISYNKNIPGGATRVVGLSNYSDSTLDYPDYEGLQRLIIIGADDWADKDSFYNNPAVYTNIPGIKSLKISQEMQTKAEEQGIDWYEVWPDLEEIEVYYYYMEDGDQKKVTYSIEKAAGAVHE